MKILLIAPHPFFQERGTPIAVKLLIETLCEFGHNIDLLTFNEGKDIEVRGLSIHRIPDLPFVRNVPIGFSIKKIIGDILISFMLFNFLRKNDYDVIHAVEESIFPAAFLNAFFKKILVYDMDSSMADQLIEKWEFLEKIQNLLDAFEKYAAERSTLVIPVCRYLGDKIRKLGVNTKIQILEDIAFDPDYTKDKKEDLRLYFPDTDLIGLYVGNLEHYQGIDLLLEGISVVESNVPFSIAIIGGDSESISFYKSKAENLNISDKIKFLGKRPLDQLPFLLNQADILISPRTKGKNTPMKVYSYLASGIPVMATNIPSHTQAMNDGQVKLFDPTPESFAEEFSEMIENEDDRKKIGEEGRKLAEENYSLRSYKRKLKHIYEWLESGK